MIRVNKEEVIAELKRRLKKKKARSKHLDISIKEESPFIENRAGLEEEFNILRGSR